MKTKRLPSGLHETGNLLEVKFNDDDANTVRGSADDHQPQLSAICQKHHRHVLAAAREGSAWIIGRCIVRIHSALGLQ